VDFPQTDGEIFATDDMVCLAAIQNQADPKNWAAIRMKNVNKNGFTIGL